MKPKRAKAVRKRMASYCHTFGFKEPYRVLCDGNFIQAALDFKLYLKEHMPKALIGRCNMVTSNCIRAELKSLGDDVSGASLVAKRFECIRCKCAKGTAADCIKNLVGKDNAEHFVVATQDQALRMFLRHTPGVPVVVVARGEIILEGASKETVAFTAKHEADKNAPDDKERKETLAWTAKHEVDKNALEEKERKALERKRKILDGEEV
ncbi:Fcf1-domain-containing protein [Baffinella frigidus]|nr:Fcf1-domain-containing protein [Cryptophyta sp. CCMP2293]